MIKQFDNLFDKLFKEPFGKVLPPWQSLPGGKVLLFFTVVSSTNTKVSVTAIVQSDNNDNIDNRDNIDSSMVCKTNLHEFVCHLQKSGKRSNINNQAPHLCCYRVIVETCLLIPPVRKHSIVYHWWHIDIDIYEF